MNYMTVQDDKLKTNIYVPILWDMLSHHLLTDVDDEQYTDKSKKVYLIVGDKSIEGELYLRAFGDVKYVVCSFNEQDVWFNKKSSDIHYPSLWEYGFNYCIKKGE